MKGGEKHGDLYRSIFFDRHIIYSISKKERNLHFYMYLHDFFALFITRFFCWHRY